MSVIFQAVSESTPGPKWQAFFERLWPSYHQWFLKQGDQARPTYLACETALRNHMPELLPLYFQLVELGGGSDAAARFLSLYCPTPYMSGCSQAVWTRDESFLIRNYDYSSKLWEATLLRTCWNGKQVMAMSDCAWGVLDGMNEDGLAVSLAFGGRKTLGDGFGIPLILRYILEFCDTTAQATDVLRRVPSHMAYNVTVLDRSGAHATLFVSPDRDVVVSRRKLATNHQTTVDWPEHERATASLDRAHVLSIRLQDPDETHERFVERFLEPPLYQFNHQGGWGTLYTATYN
ncbi:MAG: C45 family peptidase, partial [Rubripirellula sp.]